MQVMFFNERGNGSVLAHGWYKKFDAKLPKGWQVSRKISDVIFRSVSPALAIYAVLLKGLQPGYFYRKDALWQKG